MPDVAILQETARRIRCHIINMLAAAGSGHTGGSLSCVEILTALYFHVLRHNPRAPQEPGRDRFHLSKGHACPAWYATLAEAGYFPVEELKTLRKLGSRLQGHPATCTPGITAPSGSLGQGLAIACGMALAGKLDRAGYRVYLLLGDGECQEGEVWEAAMAAAHYRLDNLCAILDHNGLQIDGPIVEVMNPEPFPEKFRAFGWEVFQVDGHNFPELLSAFTRAGELQGKPSIIIAETVKGKGVSFMERQVDWHGVAPKPAEAEKALKELDGGGRGRACSAPPSHLPSPTGRG